MRLSNIFEAVGPSSEMGTNPAPKPGLAPSAAAVSGANAIRSVTGQSGSAVARALGTLGQGKTLTPGLAKALDPYADALTTILSEPSLRTKFVQLMKQAQATEKAAPAESVVEYQDLVDEDSTEQVDLNRLRNLAGMPTKEGHVDLEYGVDPKLQKLVDIGHLLRKTLDIGSGVKWDDADFNKAANLADALISIGATFGPKNLRDALKLADMDLAQAQELIAKASNKTTESVIEAENDEIDTVTMDIPLLLRVLEFAREEVDEDMDLHDLAERLIAMSKDGPLNMDDYESIIGDVEALPAPDQVDEVSDKTLSSYADKASKERDAYHPDRNKDAESARKYFNRKAGVRKALSITKEDEQLDELTKGTMGRYINKAKDSIDAASWRSGYRQGVDPNADVTNSPILKSKEKQLAKRHKGIASAVKKLTQEEEQLDELSPSTLGSYIKRASGAERPKNVMDPKNVPLTKIAAYQGDSETGHFGKRFNQSTYDKAERLRKNRETGIKTAVNKLTKEEVELDEMGYYAPGPETMPGAVGPQETTTVSFNQSKQMGDASLNINATAKDMEELHRILKLAGINYDSNVDMQEPDMQDVEDEAPTVEEPCGCQDEEPTDVKYSTDKQTLINVLRDKLQKRLA